MIDWQTIAVVLIVLAAAAYIARRGWHRLRSFRASRMSDAASCATGCGKCSGTKETTTPRTILVGISRTKSSSRS